MSFLSVKGIFRTLVGTIVLLAVISLVIEMINLQISSIQLTQMSKIACRQSAVLLSQETYKERAGAGEHGLGSAAGSTFMEDVEAIDGTNYVSGRYYTGLDAESIYNGMYTNSGEFQAWLKLPQIASKWDSIELMAWGLLGKNNLGEEGTVSMPSSMDPGELTKYSRYITAQSYKEVMMTPLNMGVPYLDKTTLENIFKWNLASIASDCNPDNIRQDENGKYCIYYNGFRVYADQATIENLEYRTYDVSDSAKKAEFQHETGINPEQLGFAGGVDLGSTIGEDERKNICIVGITYNVPIAFEGVTPIRNIFDFIWDNEVEGWEVQETGAGGGYNRAPQQSWDDTTATLQTGGFNGHADTNAAAGVLPVPGRLIYYIVR